MFQHFLSALYAVEQSTSNRSNMEIQKKLAQFCIADYDVIGFDLDGCLLKYKWDNFHEFLHIYIKNYLITVCHYDESLIKPFHEGWRDIMFRGFFVDTKQGNLLWVAGDGQIQKVFHARENKTSDIGTNIYPESKLLVLEKLRENFMSHDEFHMVDNYFEGGLVMIYCDLVEALDNKLLSDAITYQQLWDDIWAGYLTFFSISDTRDLGPRFQEVAETPALFGEKCSEKLLQWFKRLKTAKKYLFIMTSSHVVFAKGILRYIIGEDFADYFNFGLGAAGKPSFFYSDRKFVDMSCPEKEVTQLEHKNWYERGSHNLFMNMLQEFTGIEQPKVLYVGDGLKNDAFASTRFGNWGAILILEGMEVEGCGWPDTDDAVQHRPKTNKIVDDAETHYVGNSKVWGSFFHNEGKESLFARVIRESTDIAIPWLDYISELPLDYQFQRFDASSGILGYYPPLLNNSS